jgi:hypothetical protein
MIKKEYMTPEIEEIELELENALLEMSTDNGDNDNSDIEDL